MKVSGLWTSLLELENAQACDIYYSGDSERDPSRKLRFGESVTLVRGDNGCGKTILAELVSLIGHVSILSIKPPGTTPGQPIATIEIKLSPNDIAFLTLLRDFLSGAPKGMFSMGDRRWLLSQRAEERLRRAYRGLMPPAEMPHPGEPIFVEFWRKQKPAHATAAGAHKGSTGPGRASEDRKDLKEILAHDKLLRECLEFRAAHECGRDCAIALQALIAWNRPELAGDDSEDGPWHPTPRFILSQSPLSQGAHPNPDLPADYDELHFPGPVGYVNTDMYDFGSGIDIRESPKELRRRMSRTLIDRLQIVDDIGDFDSLPISETLEAIEETYSVMREGRIRAGWTRLFGKSHPMKTGTARSRDGELHWTQDEFYEFVSSGENQAFFLLSYLENLHWRDSVLVLDEPEIHLSLTAASRLMDIILEIVERRRTQVIIVTHLPHLYRKRVDDGEHQLAYLVRRGGNDRDVQIMEGAAALKQASIDSHLQVLAVVNDLRAAETPGILWLDAIRDWWRSRKAGKSPDSDG
ncbi:MAG TPA: AAA family ATPase [Allosphingosinicella sp.]|jgi:hypothetical protein|nr:AAA family ATPase [Allosphingosinicella sp.]